MASREDAQVFLNKLYSCIPRSFYDRLGATQRGFGFILSYLEQADGEVVAGDLARKLNVSTARIAALLKRMEQSGYIRRSTSAEDRRRTVVEITPSGIAYVDDMREQTLIRVEKLLDLFSKEDLDNYIRISNQIREAMEE